MAPGKPGVLNTQGCLSQGEMCHLFSPQRLEMDEMNRLATSVLSVCLDHAGYPDACVYLQPPNSPIFPEMLFRSMVLLESASSVNL